MPMSHGDPEKGWGDLTHQLAHDGTESSSGLERARALDLKSSTESLRIISSCWSSIRCHRAAEYTKASRNYRARGAQSALPDVAAR